MRLGRPFRDPILFRVPIYDFLLAFARVFLENLCA